MLEPNDVLDYTMAHEKQEPEVSEQTPEWLLNFFADEDEYDIFSK